MGKNRKQTGASAFRAPTLAMQEAFAKVSTQVPADVLDEVASALTAMTFAVAEENSSLGVGWCWLCVRWCVCVCVCVVVVVVVVCVWG